MTYPFYIPIWLDLLSLQDSRYKTSRVFLHSNMVRFIICVAEALNKNYYSFTFQYGQIYYNGSVGDVVYRYNFYIPIWLDLLFGQHGLQLKEHVFYIPIWLDLLYFQILRSFFYFYILHSNMVRFIIDVFVKGI